MTIENYLSMSLKAFMQADRPRRQEHDLSAIARRFGSDLPNSNLAEHCPGGNDDERSGGSSRALVIAEAANFFRASVFA
jgi:hypothetical protein